MDNSGLAGIILVGLQAQVLLKGSTPPEPEQFKQMQLLQRASRFRANNRLLSSRSFFMRREFLTGIKGKGLRQKFEGGAPNPMQNPDGMMNMMKGNMSMMIPNIVRLGLLRVLLVNCQSIAQHTATRWKWMPSPRKHEDLYSHLLRSQLIAIILGVHLDICSVTFWTRSAPNTCN